MRRGARSARRNRRAAASGSAGSPRPCRAQPTSLGCSTRRQRRSSRRGGLTAAAGGTTSGARMQRELTYAITPAGPADAAALAQVHVESWRETYSGILPQMYLERMSVALHERQWRHRLLSTREATLAA